MSSINVQNDGISGCFFTMDDIGRVFPWSDVGRVHRSRNGIYQRGGVLISLLTDFGKINSCYPDFEGDTSDTIFYHGAGRRGDQKMDIYNRALHDAIKERLVVPLFCKLKVNQWKFLGFWSVTDAEYVFDDRNQRFVWNYVLRRQTHENK